MFFCVQLALLTLHCIPLSQSIKIVKQYVNSGSNCPYRNIWKCGALMLALWSNTTIDIWSHSVFITAIDNWRHSVFITAEKFMFSDMPRICTHRSLEIWQGFVVPVIKRILSPCTRILLSWKGWLMIIRFNLEIVKIQQIFIAFINKGFTR